MISVAEALQIVLSARADFGVVSVPLKDAFNCFLGEDIVADRDSPPFNRVMMDGIAVDSSVLSLQKKDSFFIEAIQAAGEVQKTLSDKNNCLEVMTGAVLPINTDTIIPYENIEIINGIAHIIEVIIPGKFIHWQGADHKKGALALPKYKKINAATIGLLASLGFADVKVLNIPSVAIVATGNELVPVHEIPQSHQIRMSNVYALQAALKADNITGDIFHINDDEHELFTQLSGIINKYDVVLISGGVSKGKYDHVPDVLEKIGVEKRFHRIAQKPGKPFWFGQQLALKTHVFAFPGNPISTFICFHFYFRQWLYTSLKNELKFSIVTLTNQIKPHNNLDQFIPIVFNNSGTEVIATTNNGSGDLVSMATIDGFIYLPKGEASYPEKSTFPFIRLN